MDFSSVPFVFIFLPLFISLYLLAKPSLRLVLVLVASILFLVAGQLMALPWLIGLALTGYTLGRLINSSLARGQQASNWMWIGTGIYIGILLAFKLTVAYKTDLISAGGFHFDEIVPPLGLSYLTFQTIAYLVDVSRGSIPAEKDVFKFISYILFFPKLVAGPIAKYQQFISQIVSLNPSEKDMISGLSRILTGELKRLFIANQLGIFVKSVFDRPFADIEPFHAWLAIIAFALQIYFDFSGYTDIALGLGKVIGITLPENFNYPYISQSISEFWRRWHITLSAWFREYVFYPLERRRLKLAGQQINLLIVFLLVGLWHGPTLSFLAWGLLHGMAIAFESTVGGKWLKTLWRPIQHLYAISVILLGFVFFRSPSLPFAFEFIGRLAGNRTGLNLLDGNLQSLQPVVGPSLIIIILIAILISLPVTNLKENTQRRMENVIAPHLLVWQPIQNPVSNALKKISSYLWQRKQWWLIPMVVVLVFLGLLLTLTETANLTPFIYALF